MLHAEKIKQAYRRLYLSPHPTPHIYSLEHLFVLLSLPVR